jgi:hypothetical protein
VAKGALVGERQQKENEMRFWILTAITLAGVTFLAAPEAQSITYGEQDCIDNGTNTGCRHTNVVSLALFTPYSHIYTFLCSGTLLEEDADRFVILTAAHCASYFLAHRFQSVGVSFDAEIVRDRLDINDHEWSPKQYILGGQPVLPFEYGPTYGAWLEHYDYAVVVFDIPRAERRLADRFGRPRGEFVDLSGIPLVTLPEQDYLSDKVSATDPLQITQVGYGVGEYLAAPGDGGNAGGAERDLSKVGVRWMTENLSGFSFMGPEAHILQTSQNPARDHEGGCFGDSGGPLFYWDEGIEIQIAIAGAILDRRCRSLTGSARTDSAPAVEFLQCVMAPGADVADILACGCTEVDGMGVCPSAF